MQYIHLLSLFHGDIKLENILVKNGQVRLGDINNLICSTSIPNLNGLHQKWYEVWKSYYLVDIFAFNYLTFLLLHYSTLELREYIKSDGIIPSVITLKELTSLETDIVDKEIWNYVRELLHFQNPESKKPYLKPDMLLLDYLK